MCASKGGDETAFNWCDTGFCALDVAFVSGLLYRLAERGGERKGT